MQIVERLRSHRESLRVASYPKCDRRWLNRVGYSGLQDCRAATAKRSSLNQPISRPPTQRFVIQYRLAHCSREEVPLAALTNGLRWLLFLWSPEGGRVERRFCEIDLRVDPEATAADINRYLTRDRVSNGQAARSAERALRDSNREVVDRRAVIQGWRQVVVGLDEGLIELVATAAEQRAGYRPDDRLVRRVLAENRAALLTPRSEDAAGSGPGGSLRSTPSSFTLDSETRNVTSWSGLLVGVCMMMRDSHPGDFEKILEIRGRKLPYFSRTAGELNLPRPIGDTGIFASCQGTGALIAGRARRVVEHFGHPAGSLVIQLRRPPNSAVNR